MKVLLTFLSTSAVLGFAPLPHSVHLMHLNRPPGLSLSTLSSSSRIAFSRVQFTVANIAEDEDDYISDDPPTPSWLSVLPSLIATCRLSNVPGAFLMAACGLFRSASHLGRSFTSAALTWNAAGVVVALTLVTATSMVVNDYFDARSGADITNLEKGATLLGA